MATRSELIKVSKARLKSVKVLIDAKDWDVAGYLMGYVLEFALKAAVCKTIGQNEYPDNVKHDRMRSFFQTHDFETLLMVSGMKNIFTLSTKSVRGVVQNWSDFTFQYQSNWTDQRYKPGFWSEAAVKKSYTNLTELPNGILNQFKKNNKW